METVIVSVIISAVMASAMTFLIVRLLDRLRRRDAESEAREIVARPKQEAENRRREGELEIKETALAAAGRKRKGAAQDPRRTARARAPARQTPGRPGRAGRAGRKQEKIVEGTQRKLTEKIQEANRRKEDLSKLLDMQRQTLHELSGLNQDEATRRLAGTPRHPTPAGDRRGDPRATRSSWPKSASRSPARSCYFASSVTRPRTPPSPPPARWASPTTR